MDAGLFGKLLAIPLRVLTVKPGERPASLNVDKAKLEQAPSFATDSWPDAVERRWLRVWLHIHIWRCRHCRAEIAALAHTMPPAAQPEGFNRTS